MPALTFQFVAAGQDSVINAYRSIGQAAVKSGVSAERSAAKAATAQEKATQKAANATQKAEEKRLREVEKTSSKIQRELDKEARAAERAAEQKVRAEERVRAARLKAIGAAAGKIGSRLAGVGLTAGALAVGATGAAAREEMRLEEAANRISINARMHGQQAVDPKTLTREFQNVALNNAGTKSEDVASGVGKYVQLTGDLETARKQMDVFAKVAQASGARIEDVAEAAASLSQKFDVKDVNGMKDAMAALIGQGKQGAFTMDALAEHVAGMGAAAQRFGFTKGAQGVKELGGLANIARTSTGDAAEASTAVERMLGALIDKAPKLKGMGADVFDKTGHTRDIKDILADVVRKVGGTNMAAKAVGLHEIFGERGIKAASPLISAYQETFQKTQGTDKEKEAAAVEALKAVLDGAINTTSNWNDVLQDSAQAQQDNSAKLTVAWEQIKVAVGEKVVPEILKLVPTFQKLISQSGPLIEMIGATTAAFADAVSFLSGLLPEKKKEGTLKNESDQANDKLIAVNKEIAESGAPTAEMMDRKEQAEKDLRIAMAHEREGATAENQIDHYNSAMLKNRGRATAAGAAVGGVLGGKVGIAAGIGVANAVYSGLEYAVPEPESVKNARAQVDQIKSGGAPGDAKSAEANAKTAASMAASAKSLEEASNTLKQSADAAARNLPLNQRN